MARYRFYIDGFNVYYSLNTQRYRKYKWLNYMQLAQTMIREGDIVDAVLMFTTYVSWKPDSMARHKQYIKVLRSVGLQIVQGRFMRKEKYCPKCGKQYITHEEKQTDVNIALTLLSDAVEDKFDRAVIVSGDSDLIPIVEAVHKLAPDKEIGVLFPLRRFTNSLKKASDFSRNMKPALLEDCQFPDDVTVGNTVISRPLEWR
jgi:uncharacterized LabA/DUF88 family protein